MKIGTVNNVETKACATSDLLCIGINHRRTPIEIREKIAFVPKETKRALNTLMAEKGISEATIINTCNRVEVYAHTNPSYVGESVERFLHRYHRLEKNILSPHFYRFFGAQALTQLFRVATSLDSQIVGEPQILGQVKDAFNTASEIGATGPVLTKVFSKAFLAAKRVRNETEIGKYAVTTGFAAIEMAKKIFGEVKNTNCLIVGAGQMSILCARHIHKQGAKIFVANRSLKNAEILASQFSGKAYALTDLPKLLETCDIIVTSTSSANYLIDGAMVRQAIKSRRYKPQVFVDVALPRNVHPEVNNIDRVYAYDLDDLSSIVSQNRESRHSHCLMAEQIIDEELASFTRKQNELRAVPLIMALKERGEKIVETELAKTMNKLGPNLDPSQKAHIEAMANQILKKVLHAPMSEIRKQTHSLAPGPKDPLETFEKLFRL